MIESPGVREEFDLSVKKGLRVIPVGATGFMAKTLWNEVLRDFEKFYPDLPELKDDFTEIGKEGQSSEALIDAITRLALRIRDA